MESLIIEKTVSTPMVNFDAAAGVLEIKGESYPENISKFYTPVLDFLKAYLGSDVRGFVMIFDIPYFNSSSSKILLMILDMLDKGVQDGKNIRVKWLCEQENEMAIECGEEFKEDLEQLPFEIEYYE